MVVTAYGTVTLGIKNALKAMIETTESFVNSTYLDYVVAPVDYEIENPFAKISLISDTLRAIGAMETDHRLIFTIEINYMAGYGEDELNDMIGYVAEIIDVIEADRSLDAGTYIRNTEIRSINYSFQQGESAVLRKAELTIEIHNIRNV